MVKFLILNELHPEEQAGAATIAFDYALALSQKTQTQFVSTSVPCDSSKHQGLEVTFVHRERSHHLPGYLGEIYRSAIDLFGFFRVIRYFKIIREQEPDIIWVHQIGNYIPRLMLTLLPSIAPVMMTAHDYGLIVPRKLYPKDLKKRFLKELGVNFSFKKSNLHSIAILSLKKRFYTARRFMLRKYLSRVNLVCISHQQATIFRHFGYKVKAVIPNGISLCRCKEVQSPPNKGQVLFLGRLNGKGLERLLTSAINSKIQIHLAGSEELSREIGKYPNRIDATFHGKLSRPEVFKEIHKSSFVYLASECFDVYPTTGLEAIRHGAVPIVSDTTGLAEVVRGIHPEFVLDSSKPFIFFERIFSLANDRVVQENLMRANEFVFTVEQSLAEYLELVKTF